LDARPPRPKPEYAGLNILQKWLKVDWIGTILCLGMVCSLLLPLQWGGVTKPWNDKTVIALFCVFAVLVVVFTAWEYHMGPRAILPLHMLKVRTQIGTTIEAFFIFLGLLLGIVSPLLPVSRLHVDSV
jgi:hypothetical protein